MNLPDNTLLEDARWQQAHAGEKLAGFVATLRQTLQTPPAATPAARARHERSSAFLSTLEHFLSVNANLLTLLDERQEETAEIMDEANFNFRQMRLDRDYYKLEASRLAQRYYQENDLAALLAKRFPHLTQGHA